MINSRKFLRHAMTIMSLFVLPLCANAAEVVYRIDGYNKTIQDFTIVASGLVPQDSWAYFENEYGATTGNRYNQIPRNRQASLHLVGWEGCTINGITLGMCSNNKAGQVGLAIYDGETMIYKTGTVDFADDSWFGQWVSKDLGVYVDIHKQIDIDAITAEDANITIKGGTSEGSVYVSYIAIDYDVDDDVKLESPMGWSYEKLGKKSTLNEGDKLMMFRNGCAAADIDGMEKSHYLDAIAVPSTSDVTEPEVLRFTLAKSENKDFWTLTDQHGRMLGASSKQNLEWGGENTNWTIDLGYEGATITNERTNFGTMRYNAPVESYARFNLYTSKTLELPFLYRRDKQNEPEIARSLTFDEAELTVGLDEKNVALKPTISPKNTTDTRIAWTSDNESVATVNGGFVTLLSEGEAVINAKTKDDGAEASIRLKVVGSTGVSDIHADGKNQIVRKITDGNKVIIVKDSNVYNIDGTLLP